MDRQNAARVITVTHLSVKRQSFTRRVEGTCTVFSLQTYLLICTQELSPVVKLSDKIKKEKMALFWVVPLGSNDHPDDVGSKHL
jgi:hypothetical protein